MTATSTALPVMSKPVIERIIMAACSYFGCTEDELKEKTTTQDVVYRRKICYALIKQEVIISNARIAKRFGFKDPRWVATAADEIDSQKKIFPQISRDLTSVMHIANNLEAKMIPYGMDSK